MKAHAIRPYRVAVISDTHGHLPAAAHRHLREVDRIVHAGDIDTPEVLASLQAFSPVVAVRGNMDAGAWAGGLRTAEILDLGGVRIFVLHDLNNLDLEPESAGIKVVISGHLHRSSIRRRNGVLYLNPGSACLPRGDVPPTLAMLTIENGNVTVEFIDLERS